MTRFNALTNPLPIMSITPAAHGFRGRPEITLDVHITLEFPITCQTAGKPALRLMLARPQLAALSFLVNGAGIAAWAILFNPPPPPRILNISLHPRRKMP
jgi:hypothetical protein